MYLPSSANAIIYLLLVSLNYSHICTNITTTVLLPRHPKCQIQSKAPTRCCNPWQDSEKHLSKSSASRRWCRMSTSSLASPSRRWTSAAEAAAENNTWSSVAAGAVAEGEEAAGSAAGRTGPSRCTLSTWSRSSSPGKSPSSCPSPSSRGLCYRHPKGKWRERELGRGRAAGGSSTPCFFRVCDGGARSNWEVSRERGRGSLE